MFLEGESMHHSCKKKKKNPRLGCHSVVAQWLSSCRPSSILITNCAITVLEPACSVRARYNPGEPYPVLTSQPQCSRCNTDKADKGGTILRWTPHSRYHSYQREPQLLCVTVAFWAKTPLAGHVGLMPPPEQGLQRCPGLRFASSNPNCSVPLHFLWWQMNVINSSRIPRHF